MNECIHSPTVTLLPANRTFEIIPGRSLLDAGLSAGLALPFGCANGSCGTCRARLVNGSIQKIFHQDFVLSEAEKLNGEFLLCTCNADHHCTIEVLEANSPEDIPYQTLPAKLCRLEVMGDAHIIAVKFVRGKALRFLPGQQVSLTFNDGFTLDLPIASCPCNAQSLEFHLSAETCSRDEKNECLNRLTGKNARERISITGPSGAFTLQHHDCSGRIFIARGGEFGRLQGLIEQVFNLDLDIPSCLLWQTTQQTDQYLHNLCRSWSDAIDEFDYVQVNNDHPLLDHIPVSWNTHLETTQVYLGSADDNLVNALVTRGIPAAQIFYPF